MWKIKFKLIRKVIVTILVLLIVMFTCYSYYAAKSNIHKKVGGTKIGKVSLAIGFLSEESKIKLNQKTPRNLFAYFMNNTMLMWCGYYKISYETYNCILPVKLRNEYGIGIITRAIREKTILKIIQILK